MGFSILVVRLGKLNPDTIVGCLHLQCHQVGTFVLHQSVFGTTANLSRTDGHRHYQILLHLLAGAVCIRLRLKPVAVVLFRPREAEMLQST